MTGTMRPARTARRLERPSGSPSCNAPSSDRARRTMLCREITRCPRFLLRAAARAPSLRARHRNHCEAAAPPRRSIARMQPLDRSSRSAPSSCSRTCAVMSVRRFEWPASLQKNLDVTRLPAQRRHPRPPRAGLRFPRPNGRLGRVPRCTGEAHRRSRRAWSTLRLPSVLLRMEPSVNALAVLHGRWPGSFQQALSGMGPRTVGRDAISRSTLDGRGARLRAACFSGRGLDHRCAQYACSHRLAA